MQRKGSKHLWQSVIGGRCKLSFISSKSQHTSSEIFPRFQLSMMLAIQRKIMWHTCDFPRSAMERRDEQQRADERREKYKWRNGTRIYFWKHHWCHKGRYNMSIINKNNAHGVSHFELIFLIPLSVWWILPRRRHPQCIYHTQTQKWCSNIEQTFHDLSHARHYMSWSDSEGERGNMRERESRSRWDGVK